MIQTDVGNFSQVNAHDEDEENESFPALRSADTRPSSPPPSFHSRSSSPSSRRLLHDADQTLADTFGEGDSDVDDEPDDRQRLMRGNPELQTQQNSSGGRSSSAGAGAGSSGSAGNGQDGERGPSIQRRVTMLPSFTTPTPAPSGRVVRSANDGVFANLAAKPERGEKNEDLPPVCDDIIGRMFWIMTDCVAVLRTGCSGCHSSLLGDDHRGPWHVFR